MANTLFNSAREAFLEGNITWTSDTIQVYLIDKSKYTFSAAHEYLSDVSSSSHIAGPVTLTGKTATGGSADADDVTFQQVSGTQVGAILLVKSTGVAGTSPLIGWFDTATGLPITPNGGDIIITWDNGTNKIFRV